MMKWRRGRKFTKETTMNRKRFLLNKQQFNRNQLPTAAARQAEVLNHGRVGQPILLLYPNYKQYTQRNIGTRLFPNEFE
jgi:hypothetical protein